MLTGVAPTLFGMPIPQEHQEHIDRYTAGVDRQARKGRAWPRWPTASRPGSSWGVGSVGFAINRRTKGGPVDHDLPVLVVRDLEGKVRAVYVSYACHCVTLSNNKISGDWAGFAQAAIEDDYPGAVALVSVGCGADSNPELRRHRRQGRRRRARRARSRRRGQAPAQGLPRPGHGPAHDAACGRVELPLADAADAGRVGGAGRSRTDAIGYHARVQLARLDRGEALQTQDRLPGPDLGLRRLAGDGLPARRGRRRLLAAAEEGTRRPAALDQRLRQRRAVLHPVRARS